MVEELKQQTSQTQWVPPKEFENYRLERKIDGGGMGIIYKARMISDNRPVVIKFMIKQSQYKRFQREAITAEQLKHRNFVRFHTIGKIQGHFFIVMDYIDGSPLKKFLEKNNLSSDDRLKLFYKILVAIGYAHEKGIIHRDLKPSNILVDKQSEPVILDFGLAKSVQVDNYEDTALTIEGQILGTPGYMSPEQARGEIDKQNELSDIFSLGIILYEMLTARNPYEGENFLEICYKIAHQEPPPIEEALPGIPPKLAGICNKALSRVQEERYKTAYKFAEDVKEYLDSRKTSQMQATLDSSEIYGLSAESYNELDTEMKVDKTETKKISHKTKIVCSFCGSMNGINNLQCNCCGRVLRKHKEEKEEHNNIAIKYKRNSFPESSKRNFSPKSPLPKIPLTQPPIFAISDNKKKDISKKEEEKPRKKSPKFLLGGFSFPLAMLPIVKYFSIPFVGYIVDLLLGAFSELSIRKFKGGGFIGSLIFMFCYIISMFIKYQFKFFTISLEFPNLVYLFTGLLLSILLGMSFGLALKASQKDSQDN